MFTTYILPGSEFEVDTLLTTFANYIFPLFVDDTDLVQSCQGVGVETGSWTVSDSALPFAPSTEC